MKALSVRPSISHVIGLSGKARETFAAEIDQFVGHYYEEDFLTIAQSIFEEVDYADEVIEDFQKAMVLDVLGTYSSSTTELFGMLPLFHFHESHLFNHPLVWGLLEANMLDESKRIVKIPYSDLSDCIGKEYDTLKTVIKNRQLLREVECYQGNWARKYDHYPLTHFDDDFDFAYRLFHAIGIPVQKSDLDRYMVFEWS